MTAARGDWAEVIAEVEAELLAVPDLVAAGMFGSVARGEAWERSDLDLFALSDDADGERWDTAYLRRRGRLVHIQTLSLASLTKKLAEDRGTPFFGAMAGVEVWFDRGGHLAAAIAHARRFARRDARACNALCAAAERLHLAEKAARSGHHDDARVGLVAALGRLAEAELAAAGIFPPRDVWGHPESAGLPERALLDRAWGAPHLERLVAEAWTLLRTRLHHAAPIADHLAAGGPRSLEALCEAEPHAWGELGERMLEELVDAGVIDEVAIPDPRLGLDIVGFAAPTRAAAPIERP